MEHRRKKKKEEKGKVTADLGGVEPLDSAALQPIMATEREIQSLLCSLF